MRAGDAGEGAPLTAGIGEGSADDVGVSTTGDGGREISVDGAIMRGAVLAGTAVTVSRE